MPEEMSVWDWLNQIHRPGRSANVGIDFARDLMAEASRIVLPYDPQEDDEAMILMTAKWTDVPSSEPVDWLKDGF